MEEQLYRIRRHNFGKCYSTYHDFIKEYMPNLEHMFSPRCCPKYETQRYILLKVENHLTRGNKLAILKEINKNRIIIMDYEAIEKTDY